MSHAALAALLVVLPLAAAPLCLLQGRLLVSWGVTLVTAFGCLLAAGAIAVSLAGDEAGALRYFFGGWEPPWGIVYHLDAVNAPLCVLVAFYVLVVLAWGLPSITREVAADRRGVFHASLLLNLAGMLGVLCTGDIFNQFVFIEIASLSAYALVALGPDRRAPAAAFSYLIMGSIAANFILIGLGYLYALTGTLSMADMHVRLAEVGHTRTAVMAYAFFTVGLGIKFALFPLHGWLPAVYARAPLVVAVLFAAIATKVYLYAWLRLGMHVFDVQLLYRQLHLDMLFAVLACIGILGGSLAALAQRDLRLLLAYSSIAQLGYMVLGFSLATQAGLQAGLLHLFNHALIKGALFMAAGNLVLRSGSTRLADLAGLGRYMPWTAAALSLAALGLVGIPPTAGLISKWYLVGALLEVGHLPGVAVVLVGSLLAALYTWKLFRVLWFTAPPAGRTPPAEAPRSMLVPLWLLAAGVLIFGLDSGLPLEWAGRAARVLLSPAALS